MPKALVNDVNLHYWQVGQGSDLVLLHGLTGNLAVWHFTLVPKLRHQYRLLTYDLRGHGRSERPAAGYGVDDMVADLAALREAIDALTNLNISGSVCEPGAVLPAFTAYFAKISPLARWSCAQMTSLYAVSEDSTWLARSSSSKVIAAALLVPMTSPSVVTCSTNAFR